MEKIKIAIVEDNAEDSLVTRKYIEGYCLSHKINATVDDYSTAFAYLDSVQRYDALFLDIEMPHIDGMELAVEIRKHDSRVVIVFVTNMARYAVNGYRVDAIDYVLKPISGFDFFLTMDKVINSVERIRGEKTYVVKSRDGVTTLSVSDIRYIESLNHHLVFHTALGEREAYGYLKAVESELGDGFFRASSCYLVNLAYVKAVNGCDITVGDNVLKISRGKKRELIERLTDYYGGM
ncbi:MAG: response regulator transcription factor [Clostridia bacterium]|nr:response regulator transcription factor [Clostridia bacterium]